MNEVDGCSVEWIDKFIWVTMDEWMNEMDGWIWIKIDGQMRGIDD